MWRTRDRPQQQCDDSCKAVISGERVLIEKIGPRGVGLGREGYISQRGGQGVGYGLSTRYTRYNTQYLDLEPNNWDATAEISYRRRGQCAQRRGP
jgi:hypothetical protein